MILLPANFLAPRGVRRPCGAFSERGDGLFSSAPVALSTPTSLLNMPDDVNAPKSLEYLLSVASHRLRRGFAAELDRCGLALEHWRVLTLLADGRGWSMGELAEAGLFSLATATRTVDRMVAEALVYRVPHPEDRRKVLVFLSDKGRELWTSVKKSADRSEEAIVDRYGNEWLHDLLAKLGRVMTSHDEAASGD